MLIGVTYSPNSGSVASSRNLHTPLTFMPGATRKRTGIQSVYTSFRSSYFAPPILRTARSWSLIVTANGSLRSLGFREQRVLRADQVGADGVALAGDVMDLAADLLALVANAGRVIGEHPLRAAQVGDAHRRQQDPAQLLGGKRDRHAEDATEDAVLAQDVPERLALAEQPHARPCPAGIWYRPMRIDRRGGRISTELSLAR